MIGQDINPESNPNMTLLQQKARRKKERTTIWKENTQAKRLLLQTGDNTGRYCFIIILMGSSCV